MYNKMAICYFFPIKSECNINCKFAIVADFVDPELISISVSAFVQFCTLMKSRQFKRVSCFQINSRIHFYLVYLDLSGVSYVAES